MAILLDTHVLVWTDAGEKLSRAALSALERAGAEGGVHVSPISAWEIAHAHARERLWLRTSPQAWFHDVLAQPGVRLAALTPAIAIAAAQLSGAIHGDPADRLLVATAREMDLALVTRDDRILRYGRAGHVRVVKA